MAPVLTIDGPGGSGKGTIAARVAAQLGWHLLDSGALYRLVGLAAANQAVAFDDETALGDIARHLDVRFVRADGGDETIPMLAGVDVHAEIRTEEGGARASRVAAVPAVREALLERQRRFRTAPGLVADGRDMGTVVFPDATCKVFLDASAEERAKRRYKQLKEKGIDANLARLAGEIAERDERDRNRAIAPLVPAADATLIDSTQMTIDEVVSAVLAALQARLSRPVSG